MRHCQDQPAQGRRVQPERHFARQYLALSGNDFDAAELIGMGTLNEMRNSVMRAGGGEAVQVETADGAHFPGDEAFPCGFVQAAGVRKSKAWVAAFAAMTGWRR